MDNKYDGMTVNERLYVSGLMNEFNKAVIEKDIDTVVSILKRVELSEEDAEPIVKQMGLTK